MQKSKKHCHYRIECIVEEVPRKELISQDSVTFNGSKERTVNSDNL